MAERVIPFSELSSEDLVKVRESGINWKVIAIDGGEISYWAKVVDPKYGIINHVAVINDETGKVFDKVDLEWFPAAFVVVFRRKGTRVEFLLPSERRVLLKDEQGRQGSVVIRNIPQGLVKVRENEHPLQAALREVKEETGILPTSLVSLGQVYFDAANSQTAMPFFLAGIDASQVQEYQQSLEEGEEIKVSEEDWFAFKDILKLRLQCAKTLSGLMLATGFLGLWTGKK